MPLLPLYSLLLPTPFGEASFSITLNETGRVTDVQLPLAGLPEAVYKLTYGASWRDARTYFERLGATLSYRVEAALLAPTCPAELAGLVAHFRSGEGKAQPPSEYARFWSEHGEWMQVFGFQQQRVDKVLRKLVRLSDQRLLAELERHLFPFLLGLLALEFTRTSELVYQLIGNFRTERARDYLLGELEREGRHPFTADLLQGLTHFTDGDTLARLEAVYHRGKFSAERVEQYIRGLRRFDKEAVTPHTLELLRAEGAEVATIAEVLQSFGFGAEYIQHRVVEQFAREQDYYVLDDLLLASLRLAVAPRIDLAILNRKLAAPAYTDLPPVNWPQQLEPGWRELIRRSGHEEIMAVVTEYLNSPIPRLQRNAILQLKYYREENTENVPLPTPIERRMRELLASRYDKVYVEILNILGARPLELAERERMFAALLEVSIRSRYRTVVLRAIYRVGKGPDWRAYASDFYFRKLREADTAAVTEQIAAALPYLKKYLVDPDRLYAALAQRRGTTP